MSSPNKFYSNDFICKLIVKELNDDCDLIINEIDIKAQTDSFNKKNENQRDAIIQKSIEYIEIIQAACNKNNEKINKYFRMNQDISLDNFEDIFLVKEKIKNKLVENSFFFIYKEDIYNGCDYYDSFYHTCNNNKKFLIGVLVECQWNLTNEQKDYFRFLIKLKINYLSTIFIFFHS